jgi:hypothetical protein
MSPISFVILCNWLIQWLVLMCFFLMHMIKCHSSQKYDFFFPRWFVCKRNKFLKYFKKCYIHVIEIYYCVVEQICVGECLEFFVHFWSQLSTGIYNDQIYHPEVVLLQYTCILMFPKITIGYFTWSLFLDLVYR